MIDTIQKLHDAIDQTVIKNKQALEAFHQDFAGKQGVLGRLFEQFKACESGNKKHIGQALNALKQKFYTKLKEATKALKEEISTNQAKPSIDPTLPSFGPQLGSLHPLTILKNQIVDIFHRLGFNLIDGPEIVNDWENFQALNFPKNHPSRDMQDSFYIQKDWLLRTHTTSVQVHALLNHKLPIRSVTIGRVFRKETVSARTNSFFHQLDGIYLDKHVTFKDLKGLMYHFLHALFGAHVNMRFRGSYFPFTEPSVEIDIHCCLCHGKGCNICKYSGWIEILGAGMIDPDVLGHCKIDASQYSGLAFGMGLERIAMLLYQIDDLRLFFENSIEFLRQFRAAR